MVTWSLRFDGSSSFTVCCHTLKEQLQQHWLSFSRSVFVKHFFFFFFFLFLKTCCGNTRNELNISSLWWVWLQIFLLCTLSASLKYAFIFEVDIPSLLCHVDGGYKSYMGDKDTTWLCQQAGTCFLVFLFIMVLEVLNAHFGFSAERSTAFSGVGYNARCCNASPKQIPAAKIIYSHCSRKGSILNFSCIVN